MDDDDILRTIHRMVADEHTLRQRVAAGEEDPQQARAALRDLEMSLDQCWDLLRQRRAREEFSQDPDQAELRAANVVERYWA